GRRTRTDGRGVATGRPRRRRRDRARRLERHGSECCPDARASARRDRGGGAARGRDRMIPLEIVLERAGRTPLRLTPFHGSLRFSTNAIGGFASCTFDLLGDAARWKRELVLLSTLRVMLDSAV